MEINNILQSESKVDVAKIQDTVNKIKHEISKLLVGQEEMVKLLLTSLFTGGHVLIEGVPGIAKTMTAKLLAKTVSVDFSRIQFTPDLMPSDILGTSIFNLKTSDFNFNKGPIFSNIVLIDEINRSPAKTQAAMFEVMEELQVTVDGNTYKLSDPFFVIATQNPIEQEGTYRLPEAQLDRFLFRIKVKYPSLDEEKQILVRFKDNFNTNDFSNIQSFLKPEDIVECKKIVETVHIEDQLLDYIANIVHETRHNGSIYLGASPRASLSILKASKAIAVINGRDFVTPDDIKYVAMPILNHRILLTPDKEMEGVEPEEIVEEIINKIEIPR